MQQNLQGPLWSLWDFGDFELDILKFTQFEGPGSRVPQLSLCNWTCACSTDVFCALLLAMTYKSTRIPSFLGGGLGGKRQIMFAQSLDNLELLTILGDWLPHQIRKNWWKKGNL